MCKSLPPHNPPRPTHPPHTDFRIQVLLAACVLMWLVIAAETIRESITAKKFFAPCLGTDLYGRKTKAQADALKKPKKLRKSKRETV